MTNETPPSDSGLQARVLVVEDEALIARHLKRTLQRLGHCVVDIAAAAVEAMDKVTQHRPDLVFLDIKLKGDLTGIDVGRYIQRDLGIPFLYATASLDPHTREEAAQTQPYGYLLKPYGEAEIREAVQNALQRHRTGLGPAAYL